MARPPDYTLKYAPEIYEHMDFIQRKHYRLIAATIKQQLSHTPETRTRNRKPSKSPLCLAQPGNCVLDLIILFEFSMKWIGRRPQSQSLL
jgi:hypothetical protein